MDLRNYDPSSPFGSSSRITRETVDVDPTNPFINDARRGTFRGGRFEEEEDVEEVGELSRSNEYLLDPPDTADSGGGADGS